MGHVCRVMQDPQMMQRDYCPFRLTEAAPSDLVHDIGHVCDTFHLRTKEVSLEKSIKTKDTGNFFSSQHIDSSCVRQCEHFGLDRKTREKKIYTIGINIIK